MKSYLFFTFLLLLSACSEPSAENDVSSKAKQSNTEVTAPDTSNFDLITYCVENKDRVALNLVYNDINLASLNGNDAIASGKLPLTFVAIELLRKSIDNEDYLETSADSSVLMNFPTQINASPLEFPVSNRELLKLLVEEGSLQAADYFIEELGFDVLNTRPAKLGMRRHQLLIPFAGSFSFSHRQERFRSVDFGTYRDSSIQTHKNFAYGIIQKGSYDLGANPDLDKIWVEQLPKSNVKDYTKMMQEITNDSLPQELNELIKKEIEFSFIQEENERELERYFKLSSDLPSQLNHMVYLKDTEGVRLQLAFSFSNVHPTENAALKKAISGLEFRLKNDETYRRKFMDSFAKIQ